MRLTMREKRSVTAIVASRYRKATKKEKYIILGEFTQLNGYNRCYAAFLLREHGKRLRVNTNTVLVGDFRKRIKRNKPRIYDDKVESALKKIWFLMDCICGKRLAPMLGELIGVLERFGEIELESEVKEKLLNVSPAPFSNTIYPSGHFLSGTSKSRDLWRWI